MWQFLFISVFLILINIVHALDAVDDDLRIDLGYLDDRLISYPDPTNGFTLQSRNFEENPEELGSYLEGDLLQPYSEIHTRLKKVSYRWNNREIPFEINGDFDFWELLSIETAIEEFHKQTCIQFIPRRKTDKDYISIESGLSGCWSSIGRITGKQVVNLQTPACVKRVGTVIHELLHAVGFLHEQNRKERDQFVSIKTSNIKAGFQSNFAKSPTGYDIPYDYASITHYSPKAFSSNGMSTIIAKKKDDNIGRMGQRENFSEKDIEKIKIMYKC